jgi:signal transduction histidine kinase/PAS domain-containing protein
VKFIHGSAYPVFAESGELVEFVGAVQDATEQMKTEAALEEALERVRESEGQLRTTIDTIPGLVWTTLPEGAGEFFSQRWLDYTGLSTEEAKGDGWTVAIHPDDIGKAGTASSSEPSVIFEDQAGAVWVGTASSGLFRCASGEVVQVRLPNAGILSLVEDREGNLWVGTRGGLHRVRHRPIAMFRLRDGQPLGVVQSACQDASGALWAVTENGALMRREGDDWTVRSPAGATSREWVTCVASDQSGAIWVGARGGALYRWHDGRFEDLGLRDGLRTMALRSLLVTSGNDLWIATDAPDVLFRLRGEALQSFALPRGDRLIRAMAEDSAGNIWAGASDGMLVRVRGDAVEDKTAKPTSPSIRCLHAAANGDLWIGYAGAGVGRFRDGSVVRLNTEQGMPTDYVSQILTDDRGDLWMAGNQGIFHIRERDFAAVVKGSSKRVLPFLYGRSEGIAGLQATFDYYPSALLSSDKQHLYFSTLTGLAEFRLENARLNHSPPRVWIERLSADHRIFADYLGGGPATNAARPSPIELYQAGKKVVVRLPPGSQQVHFEFTALSLVAPENVQFRYQLEGLDKDWVEAGTRRFASYTQPPPGHYRFRVAACNNDGVWNETGDSLAVICEPYFWETHWFRLVAGLVTLAAVIGGVTLLLRRRHRRTVESLERQQTLELERARIARVMTMGELGASIAHEVNQPLAAVVTNAHASLRWLDREAPNLHEAREAVQRIIRDGKRGSAVIARIRALLRKEKAVKEQLDVNSVIREIVALASPSLQGATVQLDLASELPSVWADRVQLQQVLLNLMTNAVHAMESVIDRPHVLRIQTRKQSDDEVLVAVEDSGIGLGLGGAQAEKFFESFFTTRSEGLGLGLSISRSIVEAHGGRLWATANEGAGATFQFTLATHPPQGRPDAAP